jgi:hypothetical protein
MARKLGNPNFPSLPARPLGVALERVLDRQMNMGEQAERWGVSYRTMARWISGDLPEVQFNTADKVLCRLRLHWWDVWTPQSTPDEEERRKVQRAFEGDESLEVAA